MIIDIIEYSFNPYFTGSTTSTETSDEEAIIYTGFQSLFYWKYHFNYIRYYNIFYFFASFNPYFTGSTTSTKHKYINLTNIILFQSLFYWKYHFNCFIITFFILCGLSFNPYFTGSTTSTFIFKI